MKQLLENGMDIARINCAHNTDSEWKMIIKAIHEAEKRLVRT
jgi:pyruvate kinase